MLKIKSQGYLVRIHESKTYLSDIFKMVLYTSYKGGLSNVPFWFHKRIGYTCVIDLKKNENEIFDQIKPTSKNEIRRAEKEGVAIDILEYNLNNKNTKDLSQFIDYYNHFAAQKGLESRNLNSMAKYPNIIIGKALYNGEVLSAHATFVDSEASIASLLFSCSIRLNEDIDYRLVGWGNRLLHYRELLYFKKIGLDIYDWSGVGSDPIPKGGIAKFKLSFGGNVIPTISLSSPLFTLAGIIKKIVCSIRIGV